MGIVDKSDCDWYLENFIDLSKIDPSKNQTLCEEFFGVGTSSTGRILDTENVTISLDRHDGVADFTTEESFILDKLEGVADFATEEPFILDRLEGVADFTTEKSFILDRLEEVADFTTEEPFILDRLEGVADFATEEPFILDRLEGVADFATGEPFIPDMLEGVADFTTEEPFIPDMLEGVADFTTQEPLILDRLKAVADFTTEESFNFDRIDGVADFLTEEITKSPIDFMTSQESEDFITTTIEPILTTDFFAEVSPSVNETISRYVMETTLEPDSLDPTTVSSEAIVRTIFNATVESAPEEYIETTIKQLQNLVVSTTTSATTAASTALTEKANSWDVTSVDFDTSHYVDDYMEQIVKVADENQNMALNNSLCEWYLPTVHQVQFALGYWGVALWVLGFVITFALICMFLKQFHFIYTTAHKNFRRHLYSINSIYVVMALMTTIGSGVPRAHGVCSAVKDIYMAIGIGHFVDLTISMYGGENVMAWYLKDRSINLRVIPVCKCFCCIPPCKATKRSVNILKWLVWQMKYSQAIYYLIKLIWRKSLENSLGLVVPHTTSAFLYVHVINVFSFISGVFSLIIISSLVTDDLQFKYNYNIKAKSVRFTILVTKLQRLVFEILDGFDVYPCTPPYISESFFKNVVKDFIYLVEVLILGTITYFSYTKSGEFEIGNPKEVPQRIIEKDHAEIDIEDTNGLNDDGAMVSLQKKNPLSAESAC